MLKKLELILEELWKRSRFTSYFYQLVHFTENKDIPTIAFIMHSSRFTMLYNSDFILTLNSDEFIGLLVHEMLHIIFNHDHRAYPNEDIYLQNLAQDMIINSYIAEQEETFFSRRNQHDRDVPLLILPEGLPEIPEDFFKERDISDPTWEELYRWLKNQSKDKIFQYSGNIKSSPHDSESNITSSKHNFQLQNNEPNIQNSIELNDEGKKNSKMEGVIFNDINDKVMPTGIHLFSNETFKNKIDAKKKMILSFADKDKSCRDERVYQEIYSIIKKIQESDNRSWQHMIKSIIDYSSQSNEWIYTYSRFNRRYFNNGIYSPGRVFKEQEIITVAVDVSGSMVMSPGELEAAFGVIEELLGKYKIYLLCLDEDLFIPERKEDVFIASRNIEKPYLYKKGDWKYIKTGSSGTTFFVPLFNYMGKHREMLVVITDGYIYDLHRLKKYTPTLWLISSNRQDKFDPPFGRAITIQLKEKE